MSADTWAFSTHRSIKPSKRKESYRSNSINFQADWLNLTNHKAFNFRVSKLLSLTYADSINFHAWLLERLKGEEEEIEDTQAELAALLMERTQESLLCSTKCSDTICLSSSEDPSSAALDKEMGGLWVTQTALAIHCCSWSRHKRIHFVSHLHACLRHRKEEFAQDDFHKTDRI